MFSEYASRFLAQSQSRLLTSQTDAGNRRQPFDNPQAPQRGPARSHLQRAPYNSTLNTPYPAPVQASRFPFAARLSTAPAPLFYNASDDFREEDDDDEHEREVADHYALQRSRRDFDKANTSHNPAITEREGHRGISQPLRMSKVAFSANQSSPLRKPVGIRSSWSAEDDGPGQDLIEERLDESVEETGANRKDPLVDVELASAIDESEEYGHSGQSRSGIEEDAPSLQTFNGFGGRQPLLSGSSRFDQSIRPERMVASERPGAYEPTAESIAPTAPPPPTEPPRHDTFFAHLYLICTAALFATFLLVWLHTSPPRKNTKLGDTVYTALHACFYLFAWDTLISVVLALLWLIALRHAARVVVWSLVFAVPLILAAFTLYPFISSFGGAWHGISLQDKLMRWGSLVPAASTAAWVYTVWKGSRSLNRAISILEFSVRILGYCPALVPVGFASLGAVVAWTWIWMLMFTRIFLGGHLSSSKHLFILNASTWWQAIFFILMYLWSLGVLAGVQRAVTAATVSQWYFHRLVVPAPSSSRVVEASFYHAITTVFGTICFSTLLALAVRLPLLVLPKRISSWLAFAFYSLVPTSIAALTNPLTLTYAAIHSQPLGLSARGLSELSFIQRATTTTSLTPAAFKASPGDPSPTLVGYKLAKLLLHATRFITSFMFGVGGWVSTARVTEVANAGYRGSLYAYVVGLIAGAIGWAILGAMEGVLGGILDAVLICWGSEVGSQGFGMARYCREAGELLQGGEEENMR